MIASTARKRSIQDRLDIWITVLILILGIVLRLGLLGKGLFPFNADEAIVALMARHILQGDWPLFFYGQAYMGSLDASLVALGFALFRQEVLVIRLIQVLIYTLTILTSIILARRILRSHLAALVAGLILAVPAVNLILYTTVSLGGYGEALLIGNLIILISLQILDLPRRFIVYPLWGFVVGLGFWTFGLTLVYSLPVAIILWRRLRNDLDKGMILRRVGMTAVGLIIGLAPVIGWSAKHGSSALVRELAGSAIAGVSGVGFLPQVLLNLRNLFLFGPTVILGLRPPWDPSPLFVLGIPLVLAFWFAVFVDFVRRRRDQRAQGSGSHMLVGMSIVLVIGYLLTPFGADPSGRYFLPLSIPLALAGGSFVAQGSWPRRTAYRWVLLTGLLIFHIGAVLEAGERPGPGYTTQFDAVTRIDHSYDQALIDFLTQNGEAYGYSTYWVSFPLAFLSQEQLIFIPRLPYHPDLRYTARDDRYRPYGLEVQSHPRHAFITAGPPALDLILAEAFTDSGLEWSETIIGDYHVYYKLSRSISIDELGLPWLE